MIKTEFYTRDIPVDYGGPIPNGNYTSYDLFCLSTRMYPIIHKLLGPEIKISYDTSALQDLKHGNQSKHYLYMQLTRGGKLLTDLTATETSLLEKSVDKFTADPEKRCLVFGSDAIIPSNQGHRISNIWIRSMLGYIDLPFEYDAILDNTGFLVKLPEYSKANYEQFQVVYLDLLKSIVQLLQKMYNSGYVVTTPKMAKLWELEVVPGTKELYRPSWIDGRITGDEGPTVFLERAFRGRFQIKVGQNKVVRHTIISGLLDLVYSEHLHFEGDYLLAKVKQLEAVRQITAVVHLAINASVGRVLIFTYRRPVWAKIYKSAAQSLFPESSSITYKADRKEVFSCLRSLTKPLVDEQAELRQAADAIFTDLSRQHGQAYAALEELSNRFS